MKLLVKLGGTLLESAESRSSLARQLTRLQGAGHRLVVVHGGGKRLSRYLAGLDHKSEFRRGLRVTPPEIMDAVLRVLAGSVNRQLVAELQGAGARAVGLTGIDAGTVQASQLAPELGLVGKVERVDPELLDTLTERGFLPAVACIAGGAARCDLQRQRGPDGRGLRHWPGCGSGRLLDGCRRSLGRVRQDDSEAVRARSRVPDRRGRCTGRHGSEAQSRHLCLGGRHPECLDR